MQVTITWISARSVKYWPAPLFASSVGQAYWAEIRLGWW